jgi:N-acylneuraminate cytidylyltransferase
MNFIPSKPKVLGIVGARSGSKSIPNKNIKPLLGKPLIGWIIRAAKKSKLVDRLIVSTDSTEYAEIAKQYGAEVPFLRPAEISGDKAPDITYLTHAVEWFEKNEAFKPDIILRLPASSPLCKTESIDACIQYLINDPEVTSSRTVTEASKHPYKLWKIKDNDLIPFIPKKEAGYTEPSNMPRQDFVPAYEHTDVIAVRYNTLMKENLLTGRKVKYHMLDKLDAVDIDTEIDFQLAELLLNRRLKMS